VSAKGLSSLLTPGNVVAGKFRVERTLGEGGMGVIVAATHLQLEQQVALKVFRGDLGVDQEAAARFKREAKAAAQIRSEHVARVLDAGVAEEEIPYIVMEYLEGRTLDKVIAEQGPLEVPMAAEIIVQACEGLAEAHARGIVHRDIKPSNLFLVERSHSWQMVKLLDFGISKVALAGGGSSSGSKPDLSTKVMMGTPCYMSPEQLRSTGTVDHRTDIWSLGATLYELLAGTAPFDPTQGFLDLADAILLKPLIALRDLRRDVPEALEAVVARCLSKDRRGRFDTAGELAMALLPFAPPRSAVHAERAASIASMARNPATTTTPAAGTRTPTGKRKTLIGRAPLTSRWAAIAMGVALAVFVTTTVTSLLIGGRGGQQRQPAPVANAPYKLTPAAAAPAVAAAAPAPAPAQSELVVRATPASAQISIDGVAFTQNPVRRRYPRGGEIHRVAAYADGYELNEQDVSMANDVILDISLHRRRAAPVVPPPPARRAPPIAAASPAAGPPARRSGSAAAAAPAGAAPAGEAGGTAAAPGVDPTGGRAPLHRIVTRNPYETP
jgi:serine/threonine-protein kinase